MVPLSLPSAAAVRSVPPCLLQLLEVLKGSLGDVKSWVDFSQAWLADQRQTAQPQVCMERVWSTGSREIHAKEGEKNGKTGSEFLRVCARAQV